MHHQRHPALAGSRHAGGYINTGKRDAEGPQAGATGEFDQEEELGESGRGGHRPLAEGHAEVQVGDQPEAAAAQQKFAVQRDVEITLVVEHARGLHRHQAEEVHLRAERHPP